MGPKKNDGGVKKPKKPASGYKMPDHLPPGTVRFYQNNCATTFVQTVKM